MSSRKDADNASDIVAPVQTVELLPVLIIPGFMSSGLEIQQSVLRPDWKGRRLWINLSSLGFQSIHFGSSPSVEKEPDAKHTEYKSDWLTHMSLRHDLQSERDGVTVRAIQGLPGVDYLTPGTLTNHVSYVFGPVIKALVNAGYTEGLNLDAMSYDWRLSPVQMEVRDQYFSRTIQRVEQMYKENDETPVVIMCHSLGCKVGHYFLNVCQDAKGQEWLDKYIHTYMPVGGPHLGAPKALRSVISGDKMGLDTFLSDPEALAFGRSLGSGPWLFPSKLPPGAPSPFYFHPQGVIEVTVMSRISVKAMLKDRRSLSRSKKFKLSLVYNDNVVSTDYHFAEDDSLEFDEVFTFSTGPDGPGSANESTDLFQVLLLEPGVSASKHEREHHCCLRQIICLPFKIICFLPIIFFCMVKHVTILSAEAVSRAIGGSTILAASDPIKVSSVLKKRTGTNTIEVDLYYGDDREDHAEGGCCKCCYKPTPERVTLTMTWKPPATGPQQSRINSAIAVKDTNTKDPEMKKARKPCADLLEREGLDDILSMMREVYDTDPVGPRGRSATEAPPVKRIKAIYGINLSTEVGAVYCCRPAAILSSTENKFELDCDAKLSDNSKADGLKVKGGILYETNKMKQADGRLCSGDGTVPYYSLSYVTTWKESCQVEVSEIDKADHREILADSRFHEILIDYLSSTRNSTSAGPSNTEIASTS